MRIAHFSLCLAAIATLGISLSGCGASSSGSSAQSGGDAPPAAADAGHDAYDGHDHAAEAGHAHATEGPHGGHLIELGDEEYHAELLHDEKTHTVTVHLLDVAGKQSVTIPAAEITLQLLQNGQFVKYTLKSTPGSGDSAAQFTIVDDALCDALSHGDETRGRLQVTIDGKSYSGAIEHSSHGEHEGHDHD